MTPDDITPQMRMTALSDAVPADPRVWWVAEECEWFIESWVTLGLPPVTLHDIAGQALRLSCEDLETAAGMLGLDPASPMIELCKGEYSVCIVQAEVRRRDA